MAASIEVKGVCLGSVVLEAMKEDKVAVSVTLAGLGRLAAVRDAGKVGGDGVDVDAARGLWRLLL